MKKYLLGSIILTSLLFATDNNLSKEQLFEKKYLNDISKMKSQISVDELYKNTKDFNLSSMRKDLNISQKEIKDKYNFEFLPPSKEANESIKDILDIRRSAKFNQEILKNEEYILNDKNFDFSRHLGDYSENTKQMIRDMENSKHLLSTNKYLRKDEKIFIIISSSMNKESIKNYFAMLENVNTDVTFVLRGIIGNDPRYMKPTINYIQDLLVKNPSGSKEDANNLYRFNIEINPKLTRRFNISKVPAVLFIKNYNPIIQDYNEVIGSPDENEHYYIAYGESSIDYALREINKDAKSEGLDNFLKNMQNIFYTKD